MRGLEERTLGQRWVDSISHSLSTSKRAEFRGSCPEVSQLGDKVEVGAIVAAGDSAMMS